MRGASRRPACWVALAAAGETPAAGARRSRQFATRLRRSAHGRALRLAHLREFVDGVVHHLVAGVFGDDAFEEDPTAGRDAQNLAPTEEHSCERAVTVGDRGLEGVG